MRLSYHLGFEHVIARDDTMVTTQVTSYSRRPDIQKRSNNKLKLLWNWHIIYPTSRFLLMDRQFCLFVSVKKPAKAQFSVILVSLLKKEIDGAFHKKAGVVTW